MKRKTKVNIVLEIINERHSNQDASHLNYKAN